MCVEKIRDPFDLLVHSRTFANEITSHALRTYLLCFCVTSSSRHLTNFQRLEISCKKPSPFSFRFHECVPCIPCISHCTVEVYSAYSILTIASNLASSHNYGPRTQTTIFGASMSLTKLAANRNLLPQYSRTRSRCSGVAFNDGATIC
jgi:hypothetical protein